MFRKAITLALLLIGTSSFAQADLPPCKAGGEDCKPWERDWPAQENSEPTRVNLICFGAGTTDEAVRTRSFATDQYGNYGVATGTTTQTVPFDEQVSLWLDEETGSIRMPRVMLPTMRGGKDGWFEVASIKRTDSEITGTININFMNHPKLRLDRYTGAISISGRVGNFSGTCEPYDPTTVEKRF